MRDIGCCWLTFGEHFLLFHWKRTCCVWSVVVGSSFFGAFISALLWRAARIRLEGFIVHRPLLKKMVKSNCAVVGCTNSTYKLKLWKKERCEIHPGLTHDDCSCPQPFRCHTFPSKLRFSAIREEWIRAIN